MCVFSSLLFSSHTLALCCLAKLSTVSDHDRFLGGSVLGTDLLDGLDHIHALGHSSEDNVCAIQPRSGHSADEELTSVGVFTRVGHGQDTLTRVGLLEVLVRELHTVDGLAAGSVAVGEVTSLAHKVRDDSVEAAALVVKRLAALANTLLASAQSAEVLSSLWNNIGVQLQNIMVWSCRVVEKQTQRGKRLVTLICLYIQTQTQTQNLSLSQGSKPAGIVLRKDTRQPNAPE